MKRVLLFTAFAAVLSLVSGCSPSGQPDSQDSEPVPPSAVDLEEPIGEEPYGISKRPMPTADDLDTLLPKQVGAFERVELRPYGDYAEANYQAGELKVYAETGISSNTDEAQEGLMNARRNTPSDVVTEAWSKGTDPGFFKAGGVFMAWTRGRYFFVAKGESEAGPEQCKAALDAYMKAFPY